MNNPVNPIDTTNMSIFGISIAALTTAFQMHQYYVAGGMLLVLIASAYWYHATGSPSIPAGTTPVVTQNPPATSATQVTITPTPTVPAATPTVTPVTITPPATPAP